MEWSTIFHEITTKHDFKAMHDFLEKEYATEIVYPERKDIYQAFDLTPFEEIKVVILGQDPITDRIKHMASLFQYSHTPNFHLPYVICIKNWKTILVVIGLLRTFKTGQEKGYYY